MPRIPHNSLLDALPALSMTGKRNALTIEGFHRAGVLVPLILGKGNGELLFTKRTEEVETHKGQIAFPGGVADRSDNDIVHTALRESREELGIDSALVSVRGLLDDLAVPSGFIITPVVGTLEGLPPLALNPAEVAEVFTVPVEFFRNPSNGRSELRDFRGISREVWFYEHDGYNIWGATAMIVRLLLLKLGLVKV